MFRIKWRLWNSPYKILKLLITRTSEFNFDFHKNMLLVIVYLQNNDVSCAQPTQNSNFLKRLYPDLSNRKAKVSSDSCWTQWMQQDRKINSQFQLFWISYSIGFHSSILSFKNWRTELADVPILWTMVLQRLILV